LALDICNFLWNTMKTSHTPSTIRKRVHLYQLML
jgi:hypothetical protein